MIPPIYTSSWFTKLPADHLRVGVSRSTPRHISGFRRIRALEPGPWFNSVSPEEFHERYMAQLNALDAAASVAKILELAGDCVPVLCCYEAPDPAAPWCRRRAVRPARARGPRIRP